MYSSFTAIWWLGTIKHSPATQVGVNTHKYAQSHDRADAHKEDTEESFSHDGFCCHNIFILSSHFLSISSLLLFLQEGHCYKCACTHTQTHTLLLGPTFLSVTLSLPISLSYWQNPIYGRPLGAFVYVCVHLCLSVFLSGYARLPVCVYAFINICMTMQVCILSVHAGVFVWLCRHVSVSARVQRNEVGPPIWSYLVESNKSCHSDEDSAMRFPG